MILQLFIFALIFIVFGLVAIFRKKKFLGYFFILLGLLIFAFGAIVVNLYPDTLPF